MGGNALNIETKRISSDEYNDIEYEISILLIENGIKCFTPYSYESKQSFGDLDILISRESFESNDDMYDFIMDKFSPKSVLRNKSVISFDYIGFQVDFILIDVESYEPAKVYYSYNDLGNLMGRIANKMGFRYGHEGLRLDYASPHMSKKLTIFLSRDPKVIFTFLGFDHNRFREGFYDLEGIFKYVVYSKFFTSSLFQYENLNHQNKTRNKKRVNYRLFLEYIADKNTAMPLDTGFPEMDWYAEAEKYFNIEIKSKTEAFDVQILKGKRTEITVERLNRANIKEYFNIKDDELGVNITRFKEVVENEEFMSWQDFVEANDVKTIMEYFGKCNNLKFKLEKKDD
jgi:hypothetical protein